MCIEKSAPVVHVEWQHPPFLADHLHLSMLRSGVLQALVALWAGAAWAQLVISESPSAAKLPFAAGVDSTGRAQARSNAAGQVMIESPEYPRGLWLHLMAEAGQALAAGIQVEYHGLPNSLVALHCVDPAGLRRETLLWTLPEGDPLRLTLQPREPADLPAGLSLMDWQIDPVAVSLLMPVMETRLNGWEAVAAFLRERWQGRTGRVGVQLNAITNLAVDLAYPEAVETLVAHLKQVHRLRTDPGAATLLGVQVFEGNLVLREGVILHASRKMYWTIAGRWDSIQRADIDGTNVEYLVTTGLGEPNDLTLDLAGGKMYWTDHGTDKIQRANLDGSNIEDLVSTLDYPVGLALDVTEGKMYWTDMNTDKIQRANLDGSNVEDLVTKGLSRPRGIALDTVSGKMYWTAQGTDKIQRANLDGSNIEDLVSTGLNDVDRLALDLEDGRMYWTDARARKIQRANLDGSNVEDLVTGLGEPRGIAQRII